MEGRGAQGGKKRQRQIYFASDGPGEMSGDSYPLSLSPSAIFLLLFPLAAYLGALSVCPEAICSTKNVLISPKPT